MITKIMNPIDEHGYIINASWSDQKGKLIFTYLDKSELEVTIPISEVFKSIYFDNNTKELVINLPDGTKHRINIRELIQVYTGSTGAHINVIIEDNQVIKADILPGTIGELELMASVHLRASPTTTTQPVNDRSTRIATTEFVRGQVINNLISYEVDRALSANMGRILNERKADIEDIIQIISDLEGLDVIDHLDSTSNMAALSANMGRHLDLTKAPRVHTSPSSSTFGRATISLFGHARASDIDPLMDGTVFRGTDDGYFARADHRHPTDVTRAPIHFPDVTHNQYAFTGEPRAPLPPDTSNDDRLATTEWVRRNAVGVHKGWCGTLGSDSHKVAFITSAYMEEPVFMLQVGSPVAITFANADRSGTDITLLNVQDSGFYPVLFAGAPVVNGMIGKNHTHFVVFDGANWRLINPVPGTGIGGPGGETFGPGGGSGGNGGGGNGDNDEEEFEEDEYVINRLSGHNGYSTKGDGAEDEHGQVERVLFGVNFTQRQADVEVTFSEGDTHFATQFGDGNSVRLSAPVVVETTRHSCIVQFTLSGFYPSNSPCQLVYRTNKAWFNVQEIQ
jgi:hypothetical protein